MKQNATGKMRSYSDVITDKAAETMAHMLDFAVHDLRQDPSAFFELFLSSGLADMFGRGDIRLITSTSGVELAYRVLRECGLNIDRVSYRYTAGRSREYWAGMALAKYQAGSGIPYRDIVSAVSIQDIIAMCDRYRDEEIRSITDSLSWMEALRIPDHMSEEHYREFRQHMDDAVRAARTGSDTRLKAIRLKSGYSQSGLARASGVPVRTIQQYEQRQKDINKASFESIIKLAAALSCEPQDLIEL